MNTSVLYLEEVQALFDRYRRGEITSGELEQKRTELLSKADDPCFDSWWQRSARIASYAMGKASLVVASGLCSITLLLVIGAANLAPIFSDDEPMEPINFTNSGLVDNSESGGLGAKKLEDLLAAPLAPEDDSLEIWEI